MSFSEYRMLGGKTDLDPKKEYEENNYRNRELQRRQQERENQQLEIPDMFKAGSAARTLTGLGVEIGGNFFLDAFSFRSLYSLAKRSSSVILYVLK